MTDDDNPYAVLGVPPDATHAEIRTAYRQLATANHPDHDTNLGSSDRMTRINHAWHVLNDPARRAQYDRRSSPQPTPATSIRSGAGATIPLRTARQLRRLLVAAIIALSLASSVFVVIAMAQSGSR